MPTKSPRKFQYQGEEYTIRELAALPECTVTVNCLTRRLGAGKMPVEEAVTTPLKEDPKYLVFGEWMTKAACVKDGRCVVGEATFYSRVNVSGWDIEAAMTTPAASKVGAPEYREIYAFGKVWDTVVALAASDHCNVSEHVLRRRLKSGMPPEEAASATVGQYAAKLVEIDGVCHTWEEWRQLGVLQVPEATARYRLAKGEDPKSAFTRDSSYRRRGDIYTVQHLTGTLKEIAEHPDCPVSYATVMRRMATGFTPEEAVFTPLQRKKAKFTVGTGERLTASEIEAKFGVNSATILDRARKGVKEEDILKPQAGTSVGEGQLAEYIESLGFAIVRNDRNVIPPQEIDIYLPELKIGVEYNGLYWHSTAIKDKNYHLKKHRAAAEAGVRLISIWEDEWIEKRQIVEQMLAVKLGVDDRRKVGARACDIVQVDKELAKSFLNENHIQGFAASSNRLGLVERATGQLVAICLFKNRADGMVELVRYATSLSVPGGFTRLVTSYQRGNPGVPLVSFADLRLSDGGIYSGSGWVVDKVLYPDYMYVVGSSREHKFNFRKARFRKDESLIYHSELTEVELAALNCLYRVYDSGKLRFVLS